MATKDAACCISSQLCRGDAGDQDAGLVSKTLKKKKEGVAEYAGDDAEVYVVWAVGKHSHTLLRRWGVSRCMDRSVDASRAGSSSGGLVEPLSILS